MNVSKEVIMDNLYINTVLGIDFFETVLKRYGKDGWNSYVRKLRQHDVWAMYSTPEPTEEHEHCMPVCVQFVFDGYSFKGHDLSNLDLSIPSMKQCDFDDVDLSGSVIDNAPYSSFRRANLKGAKIGGDISGCDFSGALVESMMFDDWTRYFKGNPPIGLPENLSGQYKEFPPDWTEDEVVNDNEPRDVLVPQSIELRAFWGAWL